MFKPVFARPPSVTTPGCGVDHVAFDPTGAFLATTSGDGVLRVWRASDGELVRSVPTQREAAGRELRDRSWDEWSALAWGRVLYAAGTALQGHRWEQPLLRWSRPPEGRCERVSVRHVVTGGAGDTLVVTGDPVEERDIRWLVRPGHPGKVGPIVLPLTSVDSIPRELAVVPQRRGILVQTPDDGLAIATVAGLVDVPNDRPFGQPPVRAAAANERTIVVVGVTGDVWSCIDGEPWQRAEWTTDDLSSGPVCVALASHGDRIAIGTRDRLTVITLPHGHVVWDSVSPRATDVRFGPDGRAVVAGFAGGRVARWTPRGPPTWMSAPFPVRDGSDVVVDARHAAARRRGDGQWVVWDLERGDGFAVGPGHHPPALRWPWAAVAERGALEVTNLATSDHTKIEFDGWTVGRPTFDRDGSLVAALRSPVGQGAVAWVDPGVGIRAVLPRPDASDLSDWEVLAASAAGALTLTNRVRLDIVRQGEEIRVPSAGPLVSCADLDDLGAVVKAIQHNNPVLYRGPPDAAFRALYRHRGPVSAVALSPDGHRVASASWDGVVVVADIDGRRLGTMSWTDPVPEREAE